jgi:hypothetical protein
MTTGEKEPGRPARSRPGRRALFSETAGDHGGPDLGTADLGTGDPSGDARGGAASGRRALFSSTEPVAGTPRGRLAVVHCRTCLAATEVSLPALGLALVPSLWIPTRPWPRLMRCPACHRVAWCRIDWPSLR